MKHRRAVMVSSACALLLGGGAAGYATAADQTDDGGGELLSTVRRSDSGNVGTSSQGVVDVTCPSGTRVVGGGFGVGAGDYQVNSSLPGVSGDSSAEGWKVYVTNNSSSNPLTVQVYAVCVGGAS